MPMDEALKFLAKNFREHLERQRDRDTGDDEREIKFLLKLVLESRYISINEYDRLINHLRLKRDQLVSHFLNRRQQRTLPENFFAATSQRRPLNVGDISRSERRSEIRGRCR